MVQFGAREQGRRVLSMVVEVWVQVWVERGAMHIAALRCDDFAREVAFRALDADLVVSCAGGNASWWCKTLLGCFSSVSV